MSLFPFASFVLAVAIVCLGKFLLKLFTFPTFVLGLSFFAFLFIVRLAFVICYNFIHMPTLEFQKNNGVRKMHRSRNVSFDPWAF